MKFTQTKSRIRVQSDYWTTEHRARQGGALASLVFRHGSGRNLLVEPLTSYLRLRQGRRYMAYEETRCSQPRMTVRRQGAGVVIQSVGRYASPEGESLPVTYRRTYAYREHGLVEVGLTLRVSQPLRKVIEIGVASARLAGHLRTFGWQPSREASSLAAQPGHRIWHEFSEGLSSYRDQQVSLGRYWPRYLCALQRGVEGLEIFLGDDPERHDRLFNPESGVAFCGILPDAARGNFHLRIEPYGRWNVPITVRPGIYHVRYYLGLPFSKGAGVVHEPHFHTWMNSHWPTEEQLDRLASAGIKLIRLHNDYREDGPFWRGGCYPPYDTANMKRMDQVIQAVHRRGMRIVPYFSVKELHPECPAYTPHAKQWKRTIDRKGTVIHNYAGSGEFGAQMCLKSGWLEYRKRSIDRVLKRHDFDGVYYDWVDGMLCNHPAHAGGRWHTDIEELLEFLFWTRRRVGKAGQVFLHLSDVPVMVIENLADIVITHEEVQNVIPAVGGFNPETEMAGIVTHHVCKPAACRQVDGGARRSVLTALLEGLWTYPDALDAEDFTLGELGKFARHRLTTYRFKPARQSPVAVTRQEVKGCLYWKQDRALVYLANLAARERRCRCRVDLTAVGWKERDPVVVSGLGGTVRLRVGQLRHNGVPVDCGPWTGQILEIGRRR